MTNFSDQIVFTEATRYCGEKIIEIAKQYDVSLDSPELIEAMADMFKEGMKYVIEALDERKPKERKIL